jgi:heterodisulfide reductase subunit A
LSDTTLVIGGGIAGVQAALNLADAGVQVYLVERSPSLGGRMAQLDKTFPTNDCSTCILSPKLVEAVRHPRIEILTNSEIIECTGEAGDFSIRVLKHARYVDMDKCTGCGNCTEKCPAKVPSEFDCGISKRKAIYIPFPQAVPLKYTIDRDNCVYFQKGKCRNCEKACTAEAVDFEQKDEELELTFGSIIVATGFDQFDPSALKEYGFVRYEDVITALEFERLLSASGPTEGRIFRPSNGEVPKSITFIQCVGSRDDKHNPYCSRVCCMYAVKEAMLAKEHEESIADINILYMDMRTFGKGFEEYYTKTRDETDIHFLRGRVADVLKNDEGSMIVRYEDTEKGDLTEIATEMVMLSSALIPSQSNPKLAKILGIDLDDYGFFKERHPIMDTTSSSRTGIYICGCAQGPKDIPDSVSQAQAASSKALAFVEGQSKEEETSSVVSGEEEPGISGEETPRIGVFVCNCGINIGKVVDLGSVAAYAKTLPHVVEAQENLFTCSESTQHKIQEAIEEHNLNRVVVAACTPRTHEPLFRETCQAAGVNPYLFEMANIREHCSWVHAKDREKATEKAKNLIEMACARAGTLKPLIPRTVDVTQSALVIGGGIAGMQAALDVSAQGIPTYLVEKEERLGGRLNELHTLSPIRERASDILDRKMAEIQASRITVFTDSEIHNIEGFVGNFDVTVKSGIKGKKEKTHTLKMGAIIIAIGSEILDPEGRFGYGKYANIITNLELERHLKQGKFEKGPGAFTFILCVGAREKEGYTGCSRYCCQVAMKQALVLRDLGHQVNMLYRDIRTFGKGAEELYREASRQGVCFIRYDSERQPQIIEDAKAITVYDTLLQQDITFDTDYIILVVPMTHPQDGEKFQEMLKIPRGPHGFFLEQHPKLAPLQTNTEGIFLCGTAQGPKNVTDTITQASGAASQAIALLSKKQLVVEAATACVDETQCWGCGTCVDLCEFGAPQLVAAEGDKRVSRINEALCKGCGMCAVYCPSGALSPQHFTREQILKMIETFGGSSVA